MGRIDLEGVHFYDKKCFSDERGRVMHVLKTTDEHFEKFAEVYISTLRPFAKKGWKLHHRYTQNLCVISGDVQFVIYDARENSRTFGGVQTVCLGEDNYGLLKIPPGLIYAFCSLNDKEAVIVNCSSGVHDPDEAETFNLNDKIVPYEWS